VTNTYKTYIVAVALCLVGSPLAVAQTAKPSFAGVWTFVGTSAKPTGGGGTAAMTPEPMTIRQTATSIAIDKSAFGQVTTMTFTIGAQKDDTNRTGAQVWTTKTRWEGNALVTTGTIAQNTSAGFDEWTYTERRTLDARGHMIINTTHVDRDGKVTTGNQDWAPKK